VADARSMYLDQGTDVLKDGGQGVMTMPCRDVLCGDYMDQIKALGVLTGFKLVEGV
jgi:hypothetical protein